MGYKIKYAIWEEKGITYLKNQNFIFNILSKKYVKTYLNKFNNNFILCENYSIDKFIKTKQFEPILFGKLGAIEIIFELEKTV